MIKIGITGCGGFIGGHLYEACLRSGQHVTKIDLYSADPLDHDIIYHCAGVNRPLSDDEYDQNVQMMHALIEKKSEKSKIIFLSSTQAELNNVYGISKLQAERILKETNHWTILRLPNIFGARAKPYYNSVVATFCYQIANHQDLTIKNPDKELELIWINDLVEYLLKMIVSNGFDRSLILSSDMDFVANTTVAELSSLIRDLARNISAGNADSNEGSFRWKMETTLLSYYATSPIRELKVLRDPKGEFCELLHTKNGQFSYLKCAVGEERGMHYHTAKYERFYVIEGEALFKLQNAKGLIEYHEINSNEIRELITLPYQIHSIKNVGKSDLIVAIWANEVFNSVKPDTYKG